MMAVTYLNACDSLSGDDQCCVGSDACIGIEANDATIDKGSCVGDNTCNDLAAENGSVEVGKYSCVGSNANCMIVAKSGGTAIIGNNSCHGHCSQSGLNGGYIKIGDNSCTPGSSSSGYGVCGYMGRFNGRVVIGNDSCQHVGACAKIAQYNGDYTIGNGSCQGYTACEGGGFQNKKIIARIGDESCNAKNACKIPNPPPDQGHTITIGNNSCNAEDACRCLETGDIVPANSCNSLGDDQCCVDDETKGTMDLTPPPPTDSGSGSDPIIMGLNQQVFKFEGRDTAWYANVANEHLFWNMQFRQFDTCPLDENMFITGMSLSTSDHSDSSEILIVTTPEPIEECRMDPNAVCLGEGTLHISFDGGNTFVSQPGDYHYGSRGRVVAHNTYAACSRKWHDYEVSEQEGRNLREGGRRMTVVEKKPLALLSDKKMTMIDAEECGTWIDDRVNNNDLFQQKGHWSTLHIDTDVASFHVEYRRSDWFNRRCDFQSLDAWMTKVEGKMEKVEWNGILGETKKKIYDANTGEQVLSDRMKLLRGKDDADYEVDGPFGKIFAAGAGAGLGAMATSTS